jgi:hypothetical protein
MVRRVPDPLVVRVLRRGDAVRRFTLLDSVRECAERIEIV